MLHARSTHLYFILLFILVAFTVIYMDNVFVFLEVLFKPIQLLQLRRQIKLEYILCNYLWKLFPGWDKNRESFFHENFFLWKYSHENNRLEKYFHITLEWLLVNCFCFIHRILCEKLWVFFIFKKYPNAWRKTVTYWN